MGGAAYRLRAYASVGDYVRDLIRRDQAQAVTHKDALADKLSTLEIMAKIENAW